MVTGLYLLPGCLIGLAAWTDWQRRRIPNTISYPLFFLGILWAGWQGGWAGAGVAFFNALLVPCLLVLLPGFRLAAGDIKLASGCGAWLHGKDVGVFIFLPSCFCWQEACLTCSRLGDGLPCGTACTWNGWPERCRVGRPRACREG
ncbi:MAG: prepilin peptidase CpaA [Clostridia bacterium]|nr:prepilin peptidase CpaA [Clostridia bacterium]